MLLLVYIISYLKSVTIHKFLILDTFDRGTLCVQGREDPYLFVETKRDCEQKVLESLE